MYKPLTALGLAAGMALGCSEKEARYKAVPGCVLSLGIDEPTALFIRDEDGNGTADYLHSDGEIYWIASGFKPKRFLPHMQKHVQTMTPEMRAAATRAMEAGQDLTSLLAQHNYEGRNRRARIP